MSGKFFMAFIFVIMLATQINFCQAMPYSEMYLGGLTVGSTVDEMKRIYGEPTSHKVGIEHLGSYAYGNNVGIGYFYFQKARITDITVSANNGWKTPSGLAVGDNISKALDLYGNPDYTQSGNFKTAYCYFHKSYNQQMESKDFGFIILFNKDSGKILELGLWGDGDRSSDFEKEYQYILKRLIE